MQNFISVLNANVDLIDYIEPVMLLGVKLYVISDIMPREFKSIKLIS